jgi:hypothetical protein
VTTANAQGYDDLATDYSLSQVLEAFSILDVRGELPTWAGPHITVVASTLAARANLPTYVGVAATKATEQDGIGATAVVSGLQFTLANGKATPRCSVRNMRAFLADWRKQLRSLRPPPRFTPRAR